MQVVSEEDVWFSSPQHMQLSAELAGICCKGPLPCGQVDESTPVTWQLIRGAAVADPQVRSLVTHEFNIMCVKVSGDSSSGLLYESLKRSALKKPFSEELTSRLAAIRI